MTQEEKFLAWSKEKGLRFRQTGITGKTALTYELNFDHKMVLVIQGVTLKLNKLQDCDSLNVYFDKDGRWQGGTNIIWNRGLPWELK